MSVEKRPNGKWRARISLPGGKQRSRHFDRKVDATRWEAEQYATLNRGVWIDPSDRTTVLDYARTWAANRPHRPTTVKNVKSLIDTHLAGTSLGGRRLASVRPSEVQAWATERSRAGLGPLRLRQLVGMLRSIYRDAVLDRLAPENPVVRIQLPRHERPRLVPLSVEQVGALATAMPERNRAMVLTQAGLGLRIGELLALRSEDVDFLRRSVRVEWQIAPGGRERTRPKTPKSQRTIPLPTMVAEALAAHLAQFPAPEGGSLFTTRFGQPYSHTYYGSMIFAKAVARAGLPMGTTSHDLRHHYASVLLAAGESVVAVSERLGHENAGLVLSTYGHLMANSEDRTRKAIDQAWDQVGTAADDAASDQQK